MMTDKNYPEVGAFYLDKELYRRYQVLGFCKHSFTGEELVLFDAEEYDSDVWVRPLDGWWDDFEPV